MPEFIVFQELHEEVVLEQPMSVAAFVLQADDQESAVKVISAMMGFLPGQAIGVMQIDDRKSFEPVGKPKVKEKVRKPKEESE